MDIRFLGHAAFELSDGTSTVLIDPFLTGNPKAAVAADELSPQAILLTHGHIDHIGDTLPIATRAGSHVVAVVEIANELSADGLQHVHDPNIGGTVTFEWGSVKLVPAWHTSTTPKGTANVPAGLIVRFAGKTIYHLGQLLLLGDPHDRDEVPLAGDGVGLGDPLDVGERAAERGERVALGLDQDDGVGEAHGELRRSPGASTTTSDTPAASTSALKACASVTIGGKVS